MNSIKNKDKLLVLRFSTKEQKDCIALHEQIIKEKGFCWFGKFGMAPSEKILSAVFAENKPRLLLYKKDEAYICDMKEFTKEAPTECYPKYYDQICHKPSIYFGLESIQECGSDVLSNIIVCSTRKFAEDALYHSRISFMLCEYDDPSEHILLPENECRYCFDDFCSCHKCNNYNGFCEKPQKCEYQRR